jgi:hypothetical protein
MSQELPFKVTFVKYGETAPTSFEAMTRNGVIRAALVFHKAGAKAFRFDHFVDSVYVTDHDAEADFTAKTERVVTGEKAVHALMQLEQTAATLHRYAAKKQLQPEHHEKLLTHSLAALRDAGVTTTQLMNQVVKFFPDVGEDIRKIQVQDLETTRHKSVTNNDFDTADNLTRLAFPH